jgi:hypothetical protein
MDQKTSQTLSFSGGHLPVRLNICRGAPPATCASGTRTLLALTKPIARAPDDATPTYFLACTRDAWHVVSSASSFQNGGTVSVAALGADKGQSRGPDTGQATGSAIVRAADTDGTAVPPCPEHLLYPPATSLDHEQRALQPLACTFSAPPRCQTERAASPDARAQRLRRAALRQTDRLAISRTASVPTCLPRAALGKLPGCPDGDRGQDAEAVCLSGACTALGTSAPVGLSVRWTPSAAGSSPPVLTATLKKARCGGVMGTTVRTPDCSYP